MQTLPTLQERREGGFIYFTAETPGFSIFSVVGDAISGESVESESVVSDNNEVYEPDVERAKDTPGFTGVVSLVFVSLAYFVLRKSEY
jgi:hypothetical protein